MTKPLTDDELVAALDHAENHAEERGYLPFSVLTQASARITTLRAELAATKLENDSLYDQVHELQQSPWPEWADSIRKKLESYGIDAGPENEWDIGEQFGDWLDGAIEAETSSLRAEQAKAEADAADVIGWYGENARLCRLIHGEGDVGRLALNDDGGKRARAWMEQKDARLP